MNPANIDTSFLILAGIGLITIGFVLIYMADKIFSWLERLNKNLKWIEQHKHETEMEKETDNRLYNVKKNN